MSPSTEVIDIETLPSAKPPEQEFTILTSNLEDLRYTALTLTVTDENDAKGILKAKETRLALVKVRTSIDKKRKELKEGALRLGQRIDAAAKSIIESIEPLEKRMLDQEQFAVRIAQEKREARRKARLERLDPFIEPNISLGGTVDIAAMSDEDFENFLADAIGMAEMRKARQEKERAEAQAKADAEAAERARVFEENKALREQAAQRELEAAKTRKAAEAKLAKERAATAAAEAEARRLKEEADRAEAERKLADQKKAVEEKRIADEKAAAERKAASAPAREKLLAYSKAIAELPQPDVEPVFIKHLVSEMVGRIIGRANSL